MGVPRGAAKKRLTREDWIRAALDALAEGGVNAVAVDRLAKTVGATRGSFYWHFKDRGELIDAALAVWEREYTTELIPDAEAVGDPVERLRYVFREVYEQPVDAIETALAIAVDDPLVAPVFARVTETRLALLRRIFIDLGLGEAEADDRAWLAYAFYIGHHQLGRAPSTRALQPDRLDRLVELLTSPEGERAAVAE
jgi:AcrR family transcriptional regulator